VTSKQKKQGAQIQRHTRRPAKRQEGKKQGNIASTENRFRIQEAKKSRSKTEKIRRTSLSTGPGYQ